MANAAAAAVAIEHVTIPMLLQPRQVLTINNTQKSQAELSLCGKRANVFFLRVFCTFCFDTSGPLTETPERLNRRRGLASRRAGWVSGQWLCGCIRTPSHPLPLDAPSPCAKVGRTHSKLPPPTPWTNQALPSLLAAAGLVSTLGAANQMELPFVGGAVA